MPPVSSVSPSSAPATSPAPFIKRLVVLVVVLVVVGAISTFAYYAYTNVFSQGISTNTFGGLVVKQLDYETSHNVTGGSGTLAENIAMTIADGSQFSIVLNGKGSIDSSNSTGKADIDMTISGSGKQLASVPQGFFPLKISFSLIKTQESLYIAVTKIPPIVSGFVPQLASIYQEGTWVQLPKILQDSFEKGFLQGYNNARANNLGSNEPPISSFEDLLNVAKTKTEKALSSVCGAAASFDNWNSKSQDDKKAFAQALDNCLDGAISVSDVTSSTSNGKTLAVKIDPQKYLAFVVKISDAICATGVNGQICQDNKNSLASINPDQLSSIYKNLNYTLTLGDADVVKSVHADFSMNGDQISSLAKTTQSTGPMGAPDLSSLKSMSVSVDGSFDLTAPAKISAPSSFISAEELMMRYQVAMQQVASPAAKKVIK